MDTKNTSSDTKANTFTCQIDDGESFNFPIVNAFQQTYIQITGAQEEFEQQIENFEFNFDPNIEGGEYKLNDPGVHVDVRTGWVNIRYTATSMTLTLTVDHSSQHVSGRYDIETVQDYGGEVHPGIRVNGTFDVTYINSK